MLTADGFFADIVGIEKGEFKVDVLHHGILDKHVLPAAHSNHSAVIADPADDIVVGLAELLQFFDEAFSDISMIGEIIPVY